jgi:hypothetical protein
VIAAGVLGALWYAQHSYRAHSAAASRQAGSPSELGASGDLTPTTAPTRPARGPIMEHVPLPASRPGTEAKPSCERQRV